MESQKIEISQKTIIFTIGTLLSVWLVYQIRAIVVLLFIAFILMTAINPLIKKANKFKIPTILVMLVVYFGMIALISTVVASLVPAVVQQTKDIALLLPTYMHNLESIFNTQLDTNVAGSYLNSIPSNLLKIAAGAFSNIMNILALFFMTYYLVLERPLLHRYLLRFFENKEAVPNLGPTIAAIPVILMGLTVSPIIGLGGLVLSIIIQQLENNLIVPKVMFSATGTQPLVTILTLLVGFTLGGVAGAVLAMPIFLTIQTAYKAFSPPQAERS